jgi:uncharacterized protein with HEPN domain
MRHDALVYVGQMVDVARKIVSRTAALSRQEYDADEDVRLALAHLIQTLGEAARRVPDQTRQAHSAIPWSAIVGMRHRIVHDYLSVDFDLVWDVSHVEIPKLLPQLEALLTDH